MHEALSYSHTLDCLAEVTLCGSRKYPYSHHRGSLEILSGRGGLKTKIFKGKYEPKLELPEGWGFKPKKPQWGEYGYFLELQHNITL